MASINIREALNALSEVITNRPVALREFDQIYMKAGDMILQAEHISRVFAGKNIVLIGDGDAIGLSLAHLHNLGILSSGPNFIHLLDFDDRIVSSVNKFAKKYGIERKITAQLYNVADALPENLWQKFDGFYTNPPYGASNEGRSIEAFAQRGIEACKEGAVACLVIADYSEYYWTKQIMFSTQEFMLINNFYVSQLVPKFHHYHLDDSPDLTSCSMTFDRINFVPLPYGSEMLKPEMLANFYGKCSPLTVRYVTDRTGGGKMPSFDYELIPFNK
jgi:N4-bis(aminopropyl)spermidine synthase